VGFFHDAFLLLFIFLLLPFVCYPIDLYL
jgi:hypothetical protein